LRTIPEIITPHIGFINPNTAIFETGLYFRSTDQSEYAAADTKARYSKTATDEMVMFPMFPPATAPTAQRTTPPKQNCQPLSKTGFSPPEYFFISTEENPLATVHKKIKPSPIKLNPLPARPPELIIIIPANPTTQPMIFLAVSFSIL